MVQPKGKQNVKFHNLLCLVNNLYSFIATKIIPDKLTVVLVSGYTGVGKTTLSKELVSLFDNAVVISTDSFMLDRQQRKLRNNISGDDPSAINFDLMFDVIDSLVSGKKVSLPTYNHETGKHDAIKTINHAPSVLLLDGTSVLYPEFKLPLSLNSISIFLDAIDNKTRLKLLHDVCISERGYSEEEFKRDLPIQIQSNRNFISPSKRNADHIFLVDETRHYHSTLITRCLCKD